MLGEVRLVSDHEWRLGKCLITDVRTASIYKNHKYSSVSLH